MSTRPVNNIEEIRLRRQSSFDSSKSAKERNMMGQFATPPSLAFDIARYVSILWAERKDKIKFLEPAFGSGSFYSALLQTLPMNLWKSATAIEIDSHLANIARETWANHPVNIVESDFTEALPPLSESEKFNLIVTNPPYVRHHYIDFDEKQRFRNTIVKELDLRPSGLSGLYCYFLLLADQWLANEGLAFWLIPSEFMDVNYGSTLRRYLTQCVSLIRIHRFEASDMQFSDATVSSAVVIFQKRKPAANLKVRMSIGGTLAKPDQLKEISAHQLSKMNKWNGTIFGDLRPSKRVLEPTLSSIFHISRGIATGENSFFIMTLEDAKRRKIPMRFLKPILPSPRYLEQDVIESDADGFPLLKQRLVVIDTETPEMDIKREHPDFWIYLKSGIDRGVDKGYLCSRRKPWYKQEQRAPATFLCSYMGRFAGQKKPFRFFWNKSTAIGPNVYLLLYPKGQLAEALSKDRSLFAKVFESLQEIDKESMVDVGRVYGGGLHKLEPSELGNVPINLFLRNIACSTPLLNADEGV